MSLTVGRCENSCTLWSGDRSGFGGVGILVAEKWVEKIISADRTSSWQMCLRVLIGRKILYIISYYTLQSGLSESEKDTFSFNLLSCISIVPAEDMLIVCGDLNGHVGKTSSGFEGLHAGHGVQRVQEFSNYVLQQI